jgi:two-component system NtrC family sensor kinase
VADGDLNQYVPVRTSDEVGNLSESFNRMIDDLKRYREDIEQWNQTLEERVARRTQELAEAQARLIQSEKLAAVGELAAGIAHELNNPLAGIYAFLQVFVERIRSRGLKGLSEQETLGFQENLVHVEREIQRCKSIIGSLLSFARISEKDYSPVNLNTIIKNTLAFAQSNLRKNNIEIQTCLDENIPLANGNPNELQQVFLNIIVNAGKAMPEGGNLIINSGKENGGESVYVSVSDTGCGIKEENLERIFDPFFTTSGPGEGTGLGLSISYSIIREHGGEILAKSTVGQGTTFTILLPVMVEAKADIVSAAGLGVTDETETEKGN